MDSRIYFHQYRRPRFDNPTYSSSNVQNSMSFFNGSAFTQRAPIKNQYFRYQSNNQRNQTNEVSNQVENKKLVPVNDYATRHQSSRLSSYGQKSLALDQRIVHDKQSSKFDIISLKPKQFSDNIKQYPWLTIQNRDDVYYRRMNEIYNGKGQQRSRSHEKVSSNANEEVAGRHTYQIENKIVINPQRKQSHKFTAKMLNHMDELQHNLA